VRLLIDTSSVQFTVTRNPEPKADDKGNQKRNREGAPMWTTQVSTLDASGGEILAIVVAGEKPQVTVGEVVRPTELEAVPWSTNGRHGVLYRAISLSAVKAASGRSQ
jgi:hypothetical protein